MSISLISYCARHDLIHDLIIECKQNRPNVEWPSLSLDDIQQLKNQTAEGSNFYLSTEAIHFLRKVYECYVDYNVSIFTANGSKIPLENPHTFLGFNIGMQEGLWVRFHGSVKLILNFFRFLNYFESDEIADEDLF